ncbi:MAG TPA: benzoate-CoA ligase family protein [Chloroflexota bacterium]|jgi:benzoate-CoA ligase|nr:benzoate-CoA ligase family protein [Chloroflexota bacterium]
MTGGLQVARVPDRFNAATYFVDRNLEEGWGGTTALVTGEEEISYAHVAARVNQTGNALRSLGIEIENRVLLILLDSPEFAFSFFGAMKIGAVPVPVNTLQKAADYAHLLHDTRAKVLIVSGELLPTVMPALAAAAYLRHLIIVGAVAVSQDDLPEAAPGHIQIHDFGTLIEWQDDRMEPANTSKDDVAFWLYTSGTTGSPSAAVHLHHDMVVCSELYAGQVLNITASDRTFSVAKLFFAYGLGNALYFPFAVGAATILHPGRPEPKVIFDVAQRYQPTIFYGVPTSYAAMLHEAEQGASVDFSSVRIATSAGEPLPASLYERWLDRFGIEILDGIGTTEVLHMFMSNRTGDVRPGSSGKPLPGYRVKLLDDKDQPTPTGEIGNLLVAGDSICSGYWNRHDVTLAAIQGEWIRTRDKYHVDEDGYYWYDGRSNDMLKVGGIWVSPAEVEQAVIGHPDVLECAVVGVTDQNGLVRPKAFVVAKSPDRAGDEFAAEIQEYVKQRLAPYKYPREIEFIDELPKTATGKIQRFKLRER